MQHIPLLVVCITMGGSAVGCASNMTELVSKARECVDKSTNDMGVIGASEEQRTACWAAVNKKLESQAKWKKRQQEKKGPSCGKGLVAWCDWTGCRCVTTNAVREVFRRSRY